ncbi:MAG: ClbS/DfsB family four-helix bundle protein [Pseudomonadota bacterium]
MPAATTKADLLAVTEKDYATLRMLIADLPKDAADTKDAEDTAIRDVIGHRFHWIELFLGWWREGQAGRDVQMPAPGYTWSELKRYNADLRARQADLTWEAVRETLHLRHTELIAFINGLDDEALYGAPMVGGNGKWTTGRFAEAAGASHYRSAAKYVRRRLKELRDAGA